MSDEKLKTDVWIFDGEEILIDDEYTTNESEQNRLKRKKLRLLERSLLRYDRE